MVFREERLSESEPGRTPSWWRNPPQLLRMIFVGLAWSIPGVILGMMVDVITGRVLYATETLVGITVAIGMWTEAAPIRRVSPRENRHAKDDGDW